MKLTVGQKLWFVRHSWRGRSESHEVTVKKVGRKWFELEGKWSRYSVETLRGEDQHDGICWLTRDEHARHQQLRSAWTKLEDDLRHIRHGNPPAGVTVEDIAEVRRLLRIAGVEP